MPPPLEGAGEIGDEDKKQQVGRGGLEVLGRWRRPLWFVNVVLQILNFLFLNVVLQIQTRSRTSPCPETMFGGGCPISLDLLQCFLRRMSLEKICVASWNRVVQDMEHLKASVKDFGSAEANDLAHGDLNFWSERLRESKYNIDEKRLEHTFLCKPDILDFWNMLALAERMYCNYAERWNCSDSSDTFTNQRHAKKLPQDESLVSSDKESKSALPTRTLIGSTYLNSRPSSSSRWLVVGLSSMAPRMRKRGKAVLAGRVGWRPELLGHGDGRGRRRPQAEKGRGEDEMKRGGRGRRRAHGEAPLGADLVVGGKKFTPSSTLVRSPRQLYCCNIQEGSLHSFSVLQEKVHKKQHSVSQKLLSLLAIEKIHS